MAPRIVDRDEKRKEIGVAALDHFAQKGFVASSMSQIARAAGVGKGTIYEYFESKEALIGFSLSLYVNHIEEQVGTTLAGIPNPRDRIRRYVFDAMDAFMTDPRSKGLFLAIFHMMLTEPGQGVQSDLLQTMFQSARETIVSMILEGVSKGVFRPEAKKEAETIAVNLIATLDGLWIHSLISAGGIDLPTQVRHYLATLFRSIDGGE